MLTSKRAANSGPLARPRACNSSSTVRTRVVGWYTARSQLQISDCRLCVGCRVPCAAIRLFLIVTRHSSLIARHSSLVTRHSRRSQMCAKSGSIIAGFYARLNPAVQKKGSDYMVTFEAGERTGTGYLAIPERGQGPGVLVLHAWWGLKS